MIKSNELRIGSLIEYCGDIVAVDSIGTGGLSARSDDSVVNCKYGATHCHYIPLTEEWLKKFGFEKESNTSWLSPIVKGSNTRIKMMSDSTMYSSINEFRVVKLPYVHTLQNFMYAIQEGEELIIREEANK